jgi:arylsulfate sulfotransferase
MKLPLLFSIMLVAVAGCGGSDPAVNSAPVANAGLDKTQLTGDLVILDGSASSDDDSDTLTYTWSLTSPDTSSSTLSKADTFQPTFTPDINGTYTVRLRVNDGTVDSKSDLITITAETPTFAQTFPDTVTITENDQDSSVFISALYLELDPTNISRISFTITPKEGALAEAINATFDIDKLLLIESGVKLPIWGMYDNYENSVDVTLYFTDNSEKVISHKVLTEQYVDPNSIYDQMLINQGIDVTSKPTYHYFYLESNLDQGPIIMDIDGYIRWKTNTPTEISRNFTFDDGAFIIQSGSTLINLSLSGEKTIYPIKAPGLTDIIPHHELTTGKSGYLVNIDATKNDSWNIETILLEVDKKGNYIGQWDFGEIITNHMLQNSDDPTNFVRDGIDWFHMNSAIYDASDDSIIVSARELFVIKIDYSTKKIKWILGDETKYWAEFPSLLALSLQSTDIKPIGQHALSITDGQLMMFNNGQVSFNQPEGAPVGQRLPTSLAMKWTIDEENMAANNTWTYDAGFVSDICSSVYEKEGFYLLTYAAVDRVKPAPGRVVIQGIDSEKNIMFEFEQPLAAKPCSTWNSDFIELESLVY